MEQKGNPVCDSNRGCGEASPQNAAGVRLGQDRFWGAAMCSWKQGPGRQPRPRSETPGTGSASVAECPGQSPHPPCLRRPRVSDRGGRMEPGLGRLLPPQTLWPLRPGLGGLFQGFPWPGQDGQGTGWSRSGRWCPRCQAPSPARPPAWGAPPSSLLLRRSPRTGSLPEPAEAEGGPRPPAECDRGLGSHSGARCQPGPGATRALLASPRPVWATVRRRPPVPVPPSRRGRGQRDECLLWPAGRAALLTPADLARGVPSRAACPFPGWVSAILGGRAAEAAVGCRALNHSCPWGAPGNPRATPCSGTAGKGVCTM